MYYLTDPENASVIIKTNSKLLVERLMAEQGYVRTRAWKRRIFALLKDWVRLAIAVLAAALFVRYTLAPDYADWSHFSMAALIGAVLYNRMRERFS